MRKILEEQFLSGFEAIAALVVFWLDCRRNRSYEDAVIVAKIKSFGDPHLVEFVSSFELRFIRHPAFLGRRRAARKQKAENRHYNANHQAHSFSPHRVNILDDTTRLLPVRFTRQSLLDRDSA